MSNAVFLPTNKANRLLTKAHSCRRHLTTIDGKVIEDFLHILLPSVLQLVLCILTSINSWASWPTASPFCRTSIVPTLLIYLRRTPKSNFIFNTFGVYFIIKLEWENTRNINLWPSNCKTFDRSWKSK